MDDQQHIPEQDLKLAYKVGVLLEREEQTSSLLVLDDYLIDRVTEFKMQTYKKYEHELTVSRKKSWNQIESAIQPNVNQSTENTSHRQAQSTRSTFLKVAAILILAVVMSIFYFQGDQIPSELLIEAGDEMVSHTLSDGSIVQLRPHSSLYLVKNTVDTEAHYRLEGEALFSVTKRKNQSFVVDAGPGVIEVVGTTFNIREWGNKTTVYLKEGSLRLSNTDGTEEVLLAPGQVSSVSQDQSIEQPVESDEQDFVSWTENELLFNNRTTESILKELEYHYSIQIIAPDHIKQEVLGGSLSLESRSVSLKNLGVVLGGKFSSIGDDTYQFVE